MRTPSITRLLASVLSGLMAAGGAPRVAFAVKTDEPSRLLILPFRPIQGQVDAALAPKIEDILSDELHNHDEIQLAAYQAAAPPAAPSAAAGTGTTSAVGAAAALGPPLRRRAPDKIPRPPPMPAFHASAHKKITVSRLRAKLGDPPLIDTVAKAGYRI